MKWKSKKKVKIVLHGYICTSIGDLAKYRSDLGLKVPQIVDRSGSRSDRAWRERRWRCGGRLRWNCGTPEPPRCRTPPFDAAVHLFDLQHMLQVDLDWHMYFYLRRRGRGGAGSDRSAERDEIGVWWTEVRLENSCRRSKSPWSNENGAVVFQCSLELSEKHDGVFLSKNVVQTFGLLKWWISTTTKTYGGLNPHHTPKTGP